MTHPLDYWMSYPKRKSGDTVAVQFSDGGKPPIYTPPLLWLSEREMDEALSRLTG